VRRAAAALLTLGALLLALSPATAAAVEAPAPLWKKGENCGSSAKLSLGQCGFALTHGGTDIETSIPRGIGVDPNLPGHIYVADQQNNRVDEFTAWGQFLKTWGWDVAAEGAAGSGDLSAGSATVSNVLTTSRAFRVGQEISGAGIPAGTTINALGAGAMTLSKAATASGSGVALSVAESPGNVATNEKQEVKLEGAPSGGFFSLTFKTPNPSPSEATTAAVPFDAGAAEVQAQLEGLSNVGAGNVAVSGPSGGPWTVEFKGPRFADTDVTQLGANGAGLTPSGSVSVATTQQGASGFEVCGEHCQKGVAGAGDGQLFLPQGVAVDSAGDVYVVDHNNSRVQKFDPEGHLLLMFGGKVNKTKEEEGAPEAEQNRCPIAPTDVCQAGTEGAGNGQFGDWPFSSFIAVSPDGTTIYVGDQNRIQEFDTEGNYLADLPDPEGLLAGNTVQSLAVAPNGGDLYVSLQNKGTVAGIANPPNVYRLSPTTGKVLGSPLKVGIPETVATDPAGDVYVFDHIAPGNESEPGNHTARVLEFDAAGTQVASLFENEFTNTTGIASGSACLSEGADIYVANSIQENSFVRAFGPHPDDPGCPPPPRAPTIEAQYAVSADTDRALLRAQINPHFWADTRYYVQYGTAPCSEGGCEKVVPAAPGSLLGAGLVDESIASAGVLIAGLQPDTTYHFRFVSQSSGGGPVYGVDPDGEGPEAAGFEEGLEGTFTTFPSPEPPPDPDPCPNAQFRSGASVALPDCRAYEMVSPVDKNNGDIAARFTATTPPVRASLEQSSTSGDKLTYSAMTAFGGAQSGQYTNQYLAGRGAGGWSTEAIDPPQQGPHLIEGIAFLDTPYRAFSTDLSEGWFLTYTEPVLAPGARAGLPNIYRRDGASGSVEACTTAAPEEVKQRQFAPQLQGVSADGHVAVFGALEKLTPDASDAEASQIPVEQLYLCSQRDGEPRSQRLVSVLPNGTASDFNSSAGTPFLEEGDPFGRNSSVTHAISSDGSRVFWTTDPKDQGEIASYGTLYLRVNAGQEQSALENGDECTEAAKACTLEVSAAVTSRPARFWLASADGSKALFSFDPDGKAGPAGEKLYEFDLADPESPTPIAGAAKGVLGGSEDASRFYFISEEALSGEEENSNGDKAKAGQPNLYLHEEGGDVFIATLSGLDAGQSESFSSTANRDPYLRASRVSPDGRHAVFMSNRSLTGYDNTDANSGQADEEVYLYDADAKELLCVSCNRSGARPSGRAVDEEEGGNSFPVWSAARIPGWQRSLYPGRPLSDDGSRVFFESFEPLVLADTNGKKDVYQWEAAGTGSCEAKGTSFVEASGGCVSLVSSGKSPTDSVFVDASADGSNVFFRTGASLLPQDPGLIDVYDARAGGGFPPLPPDPPPCEGEACQSPPAPPDDPTPSSSAFEGPGNLEEHPARCGRGKARRKGRCVATKHHHKNHRGAKRAHRNRRGHR
jgi:hypothetical protein